MSSIVTAGTTTYTNDFLYFYTLVYAASIDTTIRSAQDAARPFKFSPPTWLVRAAMELAAKGVAKWIDRQSTRLSRCVLTYAEIADLVQRASDNEERTELDREGILLDELCRAQVSCREMAATTQSLLKLAQSSSHSAVCVPAVERLAAVVEDFRAAAVAVEWAIMEYDASRAPHRDGYVASSQNELSALLNRIADA